LSRAGSESFDASPRAQAPGPHHGDDSSALAIERAARNRAERLQALTAALGRAVTPRDIHEVVLRQVTGTFGADDSLVVLPVDGAPELEIVAATRVPEDIMDAWRRFSIEAPVPIAKAARTREAIFLGSRDEWLSEYPSMQTALEATGHHANVVLPMVVDERLLGIAGLAYAAPRKFSTAERDFATAFAGVCAQALDRARLYEMERQARVEAERAREVAEAANRSKAKFLARMSHELRTPLSAIGGYAELLELGVQGPVNAEQIAALQRIQQSNRHLLGLVNEVLAYSRIEAGRTSFSLETVHVLRTLSLVEALVAPQIRAKRLTYALAAGEPGLTVIADPEKLSQIVLNLLTNAIKYTDSGGSVSVSCEAEDVNVAIHVRDTGRGIEASQLERIFEPFVQAVNGETVASEGVGLGLTISRELARGMGGEIRVTSVVGEGSTFTLTLPRLSP
jgi:signal transduction histidine kinase